MLPHGEPSHDSLSTTRGAASATRFNSNEGKVLEFACRAGAQLMSVKVMEQIAAGAQ